MRMHGVHGVAGSLLLGIALLAVLATGCPSKAPSSAPGEQPAGDAAGEKNPSLVYYRPQDPTLSEDVRNAIGELKKTYGEQVDFEEKNTSDEKILEEMKKYGVKRVGGLVLFGTDGFPRWVKIGHGQSAQEIEDQIKAVLTSPPGAGEGEE